MLGKRCKDFTNIVPSTSKYYVHKHKTLTNTGGYIMDSLGFESPIFEDEKKILFENSVGTNDVIVERNRMESVLYDFKEPLKLSGLTNNLGFSPTNVFVTAIFRNGNGYFNYPPKVGYKFNFHDTWIDEHFSGITSNENGITGTTIFTGATTGFTFTGGTALPIGSILNGAFVEYNPKEMTERIVSESFHKITNPITIFNHGQISGSTYASSTNLEGLIYQPHYRIKLRELSPYTETANTNDIYKSKINMKYIYYYLRNNLDKIEVFFEGVNQKSITERPSPYVNLVSQKMGIHEWSYDSDVVTDNRYIVPQVNKEIALKDRKVEVELGFDGLHGYKEAKRCLNCDVQTVFTENKCIECDACVDICPTACISFTFNEEDENTLRNKLQVPALNLSQDLLVSAPLPTQRVMVKDEDVCLHCGLCAERCPTSAWDMQKFLYTTSKAGNQCQ